MGELIMYEYEFEKAEPGHVLLRFNGPTRHSFYLPSQEAENTARSIQSMLDDAYEAGRNAKRLQILETLGIDAVFGTIRL